MMIATSNINTIEPILKWPGGKRVLLPLMRALVPASFQNYYEPFFGGGAFYFGCIAGLASGGTATLSDANPELINFYETVQRSPEELIGRLFTHSQLHNPKHFSFLAKLDRASFYGALDKVERAARFAYLSTASFNGGYRVGRSGKFVGGRSTLNRRFSVSTDSIRNASAILKRARLFHADYRDILKCTMEGDFVYLDPPYLKIDQNKDSTKYTSSPFTAQDQRDLVVCIEELNSRGTKVLLSNPEHAFRGQILPRGYKILRQVVTPNGRREVLISNYGP